jgi:hypothetical protein
LPIPCIFTKGKVEDIVFSVFRIELQLAFTRNLFYQNLPPNSRNFDITCL